MGTWPLLCFLFSFFLSFSLFAMDVLKVGSLNVNGARYRSKWPLLKECLNLKGIQVMFLQEIHSTENNENDWGMWWEGDHVLSHGTNLSAGEAILFSPRCRVNILSKSEVVKGRLLVLKVEIKNRVFDLINVYAPTTGRERIAFFLKFKDVISSLVSDDFLIIGGDWNCTLDFTCDRNGEEPHFMSAVSLKEIIIQYGLVDIWREKNKEIKQYTWIKMTDNRVSAARLDRFYVKKTMSSRIEETRISPSPISDHHLISLKMFLTQTVPYCNYWRFSNKLLD